jgi:prepilin-type N-terminal cleavage/methylation domain-containing protein
MARSKISRLKRQQGFTLIELLVVVLIIGILASIAMPQYFKVVERGKASEGIQFVDNVKSAEETYLAQAGVYATALSMLPVGVATSFNNFGTLTSVASGTQAAPLPPTWAVTLSRNVTNGPYGAYSIVWSGPPGSFNCAGGQTAECSTDLLPAQ